MKKYFVPFIAGVLAISACQKEASVNVVEPSTVSFTASSAQTKTVFGEYDDDNEQYPTYWSGDETVAVSYNLANVKVSDTVVASDDQLTANFELPVTADAEATSHKFYAISPASACIGLSTTKGMSLSIPTTQTPVEGSCDEAAQIIFAASESYEEFPDHVDFNFSHSTAYGKISVVLPAAIETLASITLTTPTDKPIAGRFYQPFDGSALTVNSASSSITIETSSASDVYFACAPVDLASSTLKVVLTDSEGNTYTKTIDMSAATKPLKFTAGVVSVFGVDMSAIAADEVVEYTLVTDVNSLHAGDHIIIAAAESDFAIATTRNTNNIQKAAITKNDGVIKNPADAVQIITLEQGAVSNTASLNVGDGYLYAIAGSNYLKVQESKDAAASWTIAIASDGVATIVAQTSTLRYLQYNQNSNIFSCYTSASQKAVAIYSDGAGTEDLFVEVEEPEPAYSFKKATSVKSGSQYIIVAPGKGAFTLLSGKTYGYPSATAVTATADDDVVKMASLDCAFTFATSGEGYTITSADSKVVYLSGTYKSFNWGTATEGHEWSVAFDADGAATITNLLKNKVVYFTSYNTFAAHETVETGDSLPVLYEYVAE